MKQKLAKQDLMRQQWLDFWKRVPVVVRVYCVLFAMFLVLIIPIWLLEMAFPGHDEHHIFLLFADAFKVSLGAIIGALSQWAHQEFATNTPIRGPGVSS